MYHRPITAAVDSEVSMSIKGGVHIKAKQNFSGVLEENKALQDKQWLYAISQSGLLMDMPADSCFLDNSTLTESLDGESDWQTFPPGFHLFANASKRRNHVRRTYRVKAPSDVIERGVAMVLYDGKSCSRVAILFDIPRSLTRYAEKKKKSGLEEQNMPNSVSPTHHGYSSVRQCCQLGVTKVSTPKKGRKGQKQIYRVDFKNHFLAGGPLGCDGTANKSGCMNDATMDLWIKHFIHARAASMTEKKMTKVMFPQI
ncbi:hypothetical protein DAPPUDRAFT_115505 [Daphnia pulex]|uniref:Uncharacterized protein n=1 Tax=Daphnia pulex TaxID=6669 RepID=E9HLL9_DAPPU|nr:hypothetical protein DAPPUDRAFT_115505 [Daphnia pulex]|eukprot:EFX67394.1 hypothetical protein DAPPUDRAFT_115505 [Daphnia pulex]